MFCLRARLPSALRDTQILDLSDHLSADEENGTNFSFVREGNDIKAAWLYEHLSADKPHKNIVAARLNKALALSNLNIVLSESDLSAEDLPSTADWLSLSYRAFPPFRVGQFFIYGSHYQGAVSDAHTGLQIDAATAFGSGEHGTTKGCLLAMLDLKESGACPWNVLDMGTGSGILAIAAWKLWKTPVLAVDNDAEAVRVSAHHAAVNNVPLSKTDLICEAGEGFNTPGIQSRGPFDLIIANIQASTLRDMAADLCAASDENGYVILSGILHEQAEDVRHAYETRGLMLKKTYDIGEWSTLLLQNTAAQDHQIQKNKIKEI